MIESRIHGAFAISATMQALGIDRFSVAERIALMEEIWDSINAETERLPISEAQKVDLEQRLAKYEATRTACSTWEVVKARLQAQR